MGENKIYNNEHFLEVCLLQLLKEGENYGYRLQEELEAFGYSRESLNPGSLYRILRGLERRGLVASAWLSGGTGPRRRSYSLTLTGEEALNERIQMIRDRKKRIETLLERYGRSPGRDD